MAFKLFVEFCLHKWEDISEKYVSEILGSMDNLFLTYSSTLDDFYDCFLIFMPHEIRKIKLYSSKAECHLNNNSKSNYFYAL